MVKICCIINGFVKNCPWNTGRLWDPPRPRKSPPVPLGRGTTSGLGRTVRRPPPTTGAWDPWKPKARGTRETFLPSLRQIPPHPVEREIPHLQIYTHTSDRKH